MPDERALLLAPEAPYPPHSGGALRTATIAAALAGSYALDMILFREPGRPDPSVALPPGLARDVLVIDLPRHGRHAAARAWRNLRRAVRGIAPLPDRFAGFEGVMRAWLAGRRYSVAVIEHSWCAAYLGALRPAAERCVLDLHNIESVLQRRLAAEAPLHRPFFRRFASAARKAERQWLPRFDALLVTSPGDQREAAELAPEVPIGVIPNVLPLIPAPDAGKRAEIVFSGNFAYEPNTRAVRWLAEQVWPLLARLQPELRLRLVGRGEEAVRRFLKDPRIETTGAIDDALPHIARARVAVVPLRSGSGTRIKILEAWAALTPVVSTTVGAEGLPAEGVLIADAPAAFAAAVLQLLQDEQAAAALARRGREIYETRYTSAQAGAALRKFLAGIAG